MDEISFVVVARSADTTYLKVSSNIGRIELLGILAEALGMTQQSTAKVVKPADCPLDIVVSCRLDGGKE